MLVRRLYRKSCVVLVSCVVATVAAVHAADARPPASVLVYTCGPAFANLCQVNADGSGQKRITTSGNPTTYAKKYLSPSLSRDGKRLAYLVGYHLYVVNRITSRVAGPISKAAFLARISPDGTKVGDLEEYPSALGSGWVMTACVFNSNGTGQHSGRDCVGSTGSFGFTNHDQVLASFSAQFDSKYHRWDEGICLLATNGTGCERPVAVDVGHDLWDPALSPNGKLLAVTRAVPGQTQGAIALYDYTTRRLVRTLTGSKTDSAPVWSPDGSQLAFVRGATTNSPRIYAVSVKGGRLRPVASGRAVTWGG